MTMRDLTMLVNLSCGEASRLASEALDRELSRNERWALRLHTLICGNCRRLTRQLATMRAVLSLMPESSRQQSRGNLPRLSAERKQQIKQLLRNEQR